MTLREPLSAHDSVTVPGTPAWSAAMLDELSALADGDVMALDPVLLLNGRGGSADA